MCLHLLILEIPSVLKESSMLEKKEVFITREATKFCCSSQLSSKSKWV